MNTFNIRLDLDKSPGIPERVTIRQGDKSGTTITASIYDHGSLLSGSYSSRIAIALPDGEHYYRKNATFSSGVATVTIDETEAASIAGSSFGYFEILSGDTVIASTANFLVVILQSATADAVPGEPYDDAIQDAIDGLNDAVAALPDTVEDILEDHPEWTTTVQDGAISTVKLADRAATYEKIDSVGISQLMLSATPQREARGTLTKDYYIRGATDNYTTYTSNSSYSYYYIDLPPIKNCLIRKSWDTLGVGQRIVVEESDGKQLFRMGYNQHLSRQFLHFVTDDPYFELDVGAFLSQFPTAAKIGFTINNSHMEDEWCYVIDGYSVARCADEESSYISSQSPWLPTADLYKSGFSMSSLRDAMLSLTINRYGFKDLYLRSLSMSGTTVDDTDFHVKFWATPIDGGSDGLCVTTRAIPVSDTGIHTYELHYANVPYGQITLNMDVLKRYQITDAFRGDKVHFGIDFDAVHDELVDELYKGIRTATCIGDSLCVGTNAMDGSDGNTKWTNNTRYCWGTMLAAASNAEYEIVGHGGYTSGQWADAYLQTVVAGETKQVYFIGLGVNDVNQSVTIGTISDINDASPTSNPDTFYGNMGRIIQSIKDAHPHSKLIVFSIPRTDDSFVAINAAIAEITAHYTANVYLLDLYRYAGSYLDGYSPIAKFSNHKHFAAAGYAAIAKLMSRAISRYMYENVDKFRYLEFILTSDAQYIPASSE